MAKKRYKSHEELGITFSEWGALWGFKAIAEAGIVLKHVPAKQYDDPYCLLLDHPGVHFFDMATAYKSEDCGSVACIGGTVGMFCRMADPDDYVTRAGHHTSSACTLDPLYFPKWNNGGDVRLKSKDPGSYGWHTITLAMAAAAVDNFLRTGKPNWETVIPVSLRSR